MYVDSCTITRNGKKYTRHLLRESYREAGKVKKRTLANISDCSKEDIELIRIALRHKKDVASLAGGSDIIRLRKGRKPRRRVGGVQDIRKTGDKRDAGR